MSSELKWKGAILTIFTASHSRVIPAPLGPTSLRRGYFHAIDLSQASLANNESNQHRANYDCSPWLRYVIRIRIFGALYLG